MGEGRWGRGVLGREGRKEGGGIVPVYFLIYSVLIEWLIISIFEDW